MINYNYKSYNKPTYDLSLKTFITPNFHADIDPDFGVWRPNNLTKIMKGDCYGAIYHSNSYGARDKERSKKSRSKRAFVIGASNVEGFGIDTLHRFSNLIERATDFEMLNFAIAGYFSPTQMYLVYKKFHKEFDHDYVMMGIGFPRAFTEDDIDVWKKRAERTDYWKWYRPYWVGDYPNYNLVYETKKIEDSIVTPYPTSKEIKKDFFISYSWFYNLIKGKISNKRLVSEAEKPYRKATKDEINRLFFSIEKIISLAKGKKVLIYTIPNPGSIELIKEGFYPNYLKALDEKFNNSPDSKFLYTEEEIEKKSFSDLFLRCNSHLSKFGHKEMARILSKTIKEDFENK